MNTVLQFDPFDEEGAWRRAAAAEKELIDAAHDVAEFHREKRRAPTQVLDDLVEAADLSRQRWLEYEAIDETESRAVEQEEAGA